MSNRPLDRLILGLIEASSVADYKTWLGSARQHFGATSASLVPLAASPHEWLSGLSSRVTAEREAQYRERFHLVDTWLHRTRAAPAGQAFTLDMLMPEAELIHSEFYTGYMLKSGYRYRLGMLIDADGLRFLLTFWRQNAQRDFGQEHREDLEQLAPFLRATFRKQRRILAIEGHQAAFRELVNQYSHGAVIVDAALRVVFFNKAAGEYVGAEDALAIRGGQLAAVDPSDEVRFARTLRASAESASKHAIVMLKGSKSGDLVAVSIIGVARQESNVFQVATEPPAAIVLITRGARRKEIGPEDLESMLGFTPQEAQTASLLVAGQGVTDIARELSVGRETVRYFLKSLFLKTGTHSQSELVSFIGSSLPPAIYGPGGGSRPRSNGEE